MRKWFQNIFSRSGSTVSANKSSVAIGRDSNAPITIGIDEDQVQKILLDSNNQINTTIDEKLATIVGISDKTFINNAVDDQLSSRIDEIAGLIKKREITTCLGLLNQLLEKEASKASGRILFRIKANIGICKFLLGQEMEAANLLIEAYSFAPEEPKAISNKMIGLLLLRKPEEALTFGQKALENDSENEVLAGYVIQASRFSEDITEPLDLVPEGLHKTVSVLTGYIVFLISRNNKEWWNIASMALDSFPNDEHIKLYAAEGILDEITSNADFQKNQQLSSEQKQNVQKSAVILQELWDKAFVGDIYFTTDNLSACCNLLLAYHLLNKPKKIKDICYQIIENQIEEKTLLEQVAQVTISHNLFDISEKVIPKLSSSPQNTLLKFQFNAAKNNWPEISNLSMQNIEELPLYEQPMILAVVKLAKLKVEGNSEFNVVNSIFEEAKYDARACIAIANLISDYGFEEIVNKAYKTALGLINADSDFSSRLMVSSYSFHKQKCEDVIHLLNGYVDTTSDSTELSNLTISFINSIPIKEKAVKFFKELSTELLKDDFYIWASGLFYFRYEKWNSAEKWLTKSYERNKYELSTFLALVDIYKKNKSDKAAELVRSVDITNMKGHPIEKIHFSHQLREYGRKEDAIEYIYQLQKKHPKIPEVSLGYFNFIIFTDEKIIHDSQSVEVDCWVSLKNQYGETNSFIINYEPCPEDESEYDVNHPLVIGILGLKVGESFIQSRHIGGDVTWDVVEIKNKYVHALHKIMQNFEQKFPDFNGLYQLKIINNDFSPILDMIKQSSERNREMANLYLEKHAPLAFVASVTGKDVISFSEYIHSLGEEIKTCIGSADERVFARNLIYYKTIDSAVLDTYTAWIVATFDIFDVLKSICGKLLIPQSAITEIRLLEEKHYPDGKEKMTIGWHNDQFVRDELSPEDSERIAKNISQLRERIEQNCNIVSVAVPDEIDSDLSSYKDSLDSIFLAQKENSFLISEDYYYRQLFFNLSKTQLSVWLQPLITYALEQGNIDKERYGKIIVQLAAYRHGHLSITTEALLTILANDKTEKLMEFATVAYFIGGKNADIASHFNVVSTFLAILWKNSNSPVDLKTKKATSIFLENFLRINQWAEAFVFLMYRNNEIKELKNYLLGWADGHFLPRTKLVEALSALPKK